MHGHYLAPTALSRRDLNYRARIAAIELESSQSIGDLHDPIGIGTIEQVFGTVGKAFRSNNQARTQSLTTFHWKHSTWCLEGHTVAGLHSAALQWTNL